MYGRGRTYRRFTEQVTLTYATATTDDYGHKSYGSATNVQTIWASVQRISADKMMMTAEQADIVSLSIEFRNPIGLVWNGLTWDNHKIEITATENVNNRNRIVRCTGWYQEDRD